MNLIKYEDSQVPATYLGDAVYAIYNGYGYYLRLNDHRNEEGQIFLEPFVLNKLVQFREECLQRKVEEIAKRKESENLA